MDKILFSETGKFTSYQKNLCKRISALLKTLQNSGCTIIAKQDTLCVYLSSEIKFSNLLNLDQPFSHLYPIPYLSAGYINDSGADDTEYFIDECLLTL